MEDLCNKNRRDGKKVFQFSTKMRLFVILSDVTKTKSPLATSAILWSAKVNNTVFFFVLWLQCSFLVVFVFGATFVVCRSISSLCVKKWSISVTFYGGGGGGKGKRPLWIFTSESTSIGFGTLLRDKCHAEIDWFIIQRYQKQNCWAEALD